MKKRFMLFIVLLFLVGCTSQNDAEKALKAQGFTNIRMTGYDWFACSRDDFFHTGFVATNPQGRDVEGVVCSGLIFKSATVRF